MALKRNETYPGRFSNPTDDHPQGAFKNRSAPGAQDGSYLEQQWANDWDGFFGRLLTLAEVTPNGNVDTASSSQYYDALKALFLQRTNPFVDIKNDGTVNTALSNLGLGMRGTAVFTSTATWTCPAGVTTVYIDACAGGGGGAYGTLNATGGGGGGGAQAVRRSAVNVSPGETYTITIGLGGVAGVVGSVDGGNGGATSFGSLISLAGGIGGKNDGTGSAPGGGGGTYGISGNYTSSLSSGGAGGQSIFGSSGPAGNGIQVGQGGGGYGAGGGGGAGGQAGGGGANGWMQIWW